MRRFTKEQQQAIDDWEARLSWENNLASGTLFLIVSFMVYWEAFPTDAIELSDIQVRTFTSFAYSVLLILFFRRWVCFQADAEPLEDLESAVSGIGYETQLPFIYRFRIELFVVLILIQCCDCSVAFFYPSDSAGLPTLPSSVIFNYFSPLLVPGFVMLCLFLYLKSDHLIDLKKRLNQADAAQNKNELSQSRHIIEPNSFEAGPFISDLDEKAMVSCLRFGICLEPAFQSFLNGMKVDFQPYRERLRLLQRELRIQYVFLHSVSRREILKFLKDLEVQLNRAEDVSFEFNSSISKLPLLNVQFEMFLGVWVEREKGRSKRIDISEPKLRNFKNTNFPCHSFLQQQLDQADFSKANLKYADFCGASLCYANLEQCDLTNAAMSSCRLTESNLKGAQLVNVDLEYADLSNAILDDARIEEANLSGTKFEGASLAGARLDRIDLKTANLDGANLQGARLREVVLEKVNLEGANFSEAYFSSSSAQNALLNRANFNQAVFIFTNFAGAKMKEANLNATYLQDSVFDDVDLTGATLVDANLFSASFERAILVGADLTNAESNGSMIDPSIFEGAKYSKSTIWPEGFTPTEDLILVEES